jgi:hypothetical protein
LQNHVVSEERWQADIRPRPRPKSEQQRKRCSQ